MSTFITVANTINFVKPLIKNQPVFVTGQEPGLTVANIVLQRLLGPPFRWPWNRKSFTFDTEVTTPPTTDYTVALADFGFLEDQWLVDPSGNIYQLNGATSLAVDSNLSRPTQIAVQFDDNEGNITFRVQNAPDKVYTVNGDYQAKPSLIQAFGSTWGPVADNFGYIYNLGYLAFISLLVNDSRFPIYEKWFVGSLLGAQDGLTDQERNIFLAAWMSDVRSIARSQGIVNSGVAGRGQ